MANDAEQRFNIEFAGECLEGHSPEAVRAGLAALFKADAAALERLFSGKRQRIKGDCDKATALKYQKAMTGVGARAIITASAPAVPAAEPASGDGSAPTKNAVVSAETTADTADITLAPAGSEVLTADERQDPIVPDLDLSHLSVAEAGTALAEASEAPTPLPAPDLDIAETGARLAPEPTGAPPEPPDTSALDLAPEGQDVSDCQPPAAALAPPETAHLSVADAGSELLREDERQQVTAAAPDTSHLSAETPQDIAPKENPFLSND
jgi:hypothetical protein